MNKIAQKNLRTALFLSLVALGMFVYSFIVIRHRGRLVEPSNLSPLQKILRGL